MMRSESPLFQYTLLPQVYYSKCKNLATTSFGR